jgi:hypothetical protein
MGQIDGGHTVLAILESVGKRMMYRGPMAGAQL